MKNKKGFTLAEVLIVLAVIGIIAAITINIIATNSRKTEIETKLKKTVSILNGAMYRATIDYGDPTTWSELKIETADPKIFMKKYFVPYLITTRPLQAVSLKDLGYKEDYIKTPDGGNFVQLLNKNEQRIFLNDGTVILGGIFTVGNAFVFIVDINGPKGPNMAGRDVFQLGINLYNRQNLSIQAQGLTSGRVDKNTGEYIITEMNRTAAKTNCSTGGILCSALIQKNSWKIPSDYPIKI